MSVVFAGTLAAVTAVAAAVLALSLRGARASHPGIAHPDGRALADAGWRHGTARWEQLRCAIAGVTIVATLALGLPVALAIASLAAPSVWIRLRAEAARERAHRSLPAILVTTAAAVRSGVSLPDALQRAADTSADELAARPFARALRAFSAGVGLDAALRETAVAAGDHRARVALGSLALGVAERLPRERLADLVAAVAERAEFEERLNDEVRARAAGARQQQVLLAALVPMLALYLCITMPTLADTLGSDLGRFVLIPGAVALEVAGVLVGRRVVASAIS